MVDYQERPSFRRTNQEMSAKDISQIYHSLHTLGDKVRLYMVASGNIAHNGVCQHLHDPDVGITTPEILERVLDVLLEENHFPSIKHFSALGYNLENPDALRAIELTCARKGNYYRVRITPSSF